MTETRGSAGGPSPGRSWSDLRPRIVSGAVLLSGALLAIWIGGPVLSAVIATIYAGAYREWEMMVGNKRVDWPAAVSIGLVALSIISIEAGGFATAAVVLGVALVFALIFGGPGRWWRIGGMAVMVMAALSILGLRGSSVGGITARSMRRAIRWIERLTARSGFGVRMANSCPTFLHRPPCLPIRCGPSARGTTRRGCASMRGRRARPGWGSA